MAVYKRVPAKNSDSCEVDKASGGYAIVVL